MKRLISWALLLGPILVTMPAGANDIEARAAQCAACHGANGLPADENIPIIDGQQFYYLFLQLKDFKAGRRANPIMAGVVADLDRAQMKALAEHFAAKPWPSTGYRPPDDIAGAATAALGAGQCMQCHLGGYEGSGAFARLAGQHPAYLERTMLELKTSERKNAPDKSSLFRTYDASDITLMAKYLGGL